MLRWDVAFHKLREHIILIIDVIIAWRYANRLDTHDRDIVENGIAGQLVANQHCTVVAVVILFPSGLVFVGRKRERSDGLRRWRAYAV